MDIETLIKENNELKILVNELQEKLKRYTNPDRNKKYYENNKEKFIQNGNERLKKLKETNPEKLKEYRQKAYLKRKEKLICEHNKNIELCRICDGSKLCISGICDTIQNIKYDNHCLRCFIHLFPDKPVTRNYKTKESSVATFVTENFSKFTWNIDKTIQDGCSRRRPDLICDLGYQVIIVEIDENQHYKYDCSCENKRIMELSQDVGHRPIVFIRFNPDDYIDASNKNITSCWGLTPKTGLLKIIDKKQNEWNNRLNTLKQQIEYWCNEDNKIEKTIEIIQLFYDEIDNNNN